MMRNTQYTSTLPKINEPGFYTRRNDQSSTLLEFPAVKGIHQLNNTSGDLNVSKLTGRSPFSKQKDFDITGTFNMRSPAAIAQRERKFMSKHISGNIGEKEDPKEVILKMRRKLEIKIATL
jgi:hypothetical protein